MSDRSFDDVSCDVPLPPERTDLSDAEVLWAESTQTRVDFWQQFGPMKSLHRQSILMGLLGIGGGLMALAFLMPFEMELVQDLFVGRPPFWVMMLVFQVIMLPAITVASFAIAVPMFWHISVFVRFLTALALYVPAVVGFFVAFSIVQSGPNANEFPIIAFLFAVAFAASAVVGVVMQMVTPWSLTHLRASAEPLPRLGTRTLFELTAAIAVMMAFVSALPVETDLFLPAMAFASIAGFATLTGTIACVGFLREDNDAVEHYAVKRTPVAIAVAAAFLTSGALVSTFAVAEFGWTSIIDQIVVTLPTTVSGAVVILVTMALCLGWLRSCGWRVVR